MIMPALRLPVVVALMVTAMPVEAQKPEEPDGYICTEVSSSDLGRFTVTREVGDGKMRMTAHWQGYRTGKIGVSGLWQSEDLRAGKLNILYFNPKDARPVRVQYDPCRDWKVCRNFTYYRSSLLDRPWGKASWGAVAAIGADRGEVYVHVIDKDDNTVQEDRIDISVFNGVESELHRLLDKTAARATNASVQCEPVYALILIN